MSLAVATSATGLELRPFRRAGGGGRNKGCGLSARAAESGFRTSGRDNPTGHIPGMAPGSSPARRGRGQSNAASPTWFPQGSLRAPTGLPQGLIQMLLSHVGAMCYGGGEGRAGVSQICDTGLPGSCRFRAREALRLLAAPPRLPHQLSVQRPRNTGPRRQSPGPHAARALRRPP